MAVGQFRARSGTELIDAAFQLVKSNYAPLVTIAALGAIPGLLAAIVDPGSSRRGTGSPLGMVLQLIYVITAFLAQVALIRATSDAYLGQAIDVGASFRFSAGTALRYIGTGLATGVFALFGFILLIVPGFIVIAMLFFAPTLVVLEGLGVSDALSRSRVLTEGRRLSLFACLLIFIVTMMLAAMIVGLIAGLTHLTMVASLASVIVLILVTPLLPAFIILHYYDARIRKEGYDIELMAQATPGTVGAAAPVV